MKQFKLLYIGALLLMVGLVSSCSNDDGYRVDDGDVDPALLPNPEITASANSIIQFETIDFTPGVVNEGDLYTWSFPGGSPGSSSSANVTVKYTVRGTYPVTLKVRNKYGATEVVKEGFVQVEGEPLDPAIVIRLNFEQSLFEEVAGTNLTGGVSSYQEGVVNDFGATFQGEGLTKDGYNGITGNSPRSVSVWVKTTNSSSRSGITTWGAPGTFSRNTFVLNSNGTVRFEYQGGGQNSTGTVNDGVWHHIAYTYDGANIKVYIDGVLDFDRPETRVNTGVSGDRQFTIGCEGTSTGALNFRPYTGGMDDFRLYDKALTDAEIAELAGI